MTDDIEARLLATGASQGDIDEARSGGWLPLLALDRSLMPGEPLYDLDQLAVVAGVDIDTTRQVWRSLGFPDVPEGVGMFTDRDAALLARLVDRSDFERIGRDFSLQRLTEQVRVVSGAMARIAALEADEVAITLQVARSQLPGDDSTPEGHAAHQEQLAALAADLLDWDTLNALIDYVHRIQLRAALWRRLADPTADANLAETAIGFVDIVGYTSVVQQIDDTQLAALLSHFEAVVHDSVAARGGRVVKLIGDAVLYSGPPAVVAAIALDLLDPSTRLPALSQGLAFGSVLMRDGDLFGPVVNLASRLCDIARPQSILISEPMADAIADDGRFDLKSLRSRKLRGIGEVRLAVLRPGPAWSEHTDG